MRPPMRSVVLVLCGLGGLTALASAVARADPLTSMDQVGAAITSCWRPPDGVKNSSVTLSFSLKRDGTLIGPPQPTAIAVDGDDSTRKAFVDAAINAVVGCTPLDLSPDIAQGIGGQVFTLAFTSSDQAQQIDPDNQ